MYAELKEEGIESEYSYCPHCGAPMIDWGDVMTEVALIPGGGQVAENIEHECEPHHLPAPPPTARQLVVLAERYYREGLGAGHRDVEKTIERLERNYRVNLSRYPELAERIRERLAAL